MNKQRIVILGAGYGGLMTAIELQRNLKDNPAEITLVNKHPYHYQTTWLHETAAGTIHHDQTRIAIREVINKQRIQFMEDTVIAINPEEKKVKLKNGEICYDTLVIGLGFEAETFGIPGLKENAFMIGTLNKARLLREHLAYNFAQYHNEEKKDPARLNIVVGGGGFTGIEFLGELANRIPELCEEYDIDKVKVRMISIESSPTVLPGFDPDLVEYAMNSLETRGGRVCNRRIVKGVWSRLYRL
ncbi:FAD-dependent oxidoreductase [Virgibacillus halophilus]|uniref:FAD-dependent oxidoreductase n=1 Tax=Tigheibacillus halophilus TaxID=361280 RepID=A0ABU5C1K0_9BACI|nr:FAD-dependent oxidoreductase [Virgibacillus halophilus]